MNLSRVPRPLLAVVVAFVPLAAAAGVTPPRILQTTEVRFPATFALSVVASGSAEVIVNIDADGQLVDLLVSRYSRREFADEAVGALRKWRFEPARRDGESVGARFVVKFDFSAPGKVATLTVFETIESRLQLQQKSGTAEVVSSTRKLDHPPAAVTTVQPVHPGSLPDATQDARVVVDYLIDQEGRPRMPVVLEATRDGYALAAVDALAQWRFTPPTSGGRPVAVQVRQEFVFQQVP
jgi:TonB family protein